MRTCWCLNREATGRTALLNFLSSNHDVLSVCVDQCYSKDASVAKAYFQVLHNFLHITFHSFYIIVRVRV